MKTRAVIQARMLSSRLRGKSLLSVAGKPLLDRVILAIRRMDFIDEIVVATTLDATDDPIEAVALRREVPCVRGERDNVLARFLKATVDMHESDCLLRFTADNPLYDTGKTKAAWNEHLAADADYTFVDGLSPMVPEFLQVAALRHSAEMAQDDFDREHVTPCIRKHPEQFKCRRLSSDFAGLRPDLNPFLTIDRQDQLEMVETMLNELETGDSPPSVDDCYAWLDARRMGLPKVAPAQPGDKRVALAGHEIGDGCPCFIVAEIGQNHNGQLNLAKRLIDMAARCGATAVKFQKRDIRWDLTEEAYNRPYENPNSFGKTYGEHREYLELSEEEHLELREFALANRLVYFCTPCDPPSVEMMERIGNPFYKVASRDITNIPLLKMIAATGKPVLLSTGMAGLQEIREALEALGDGPAGIVLLQCTSQYPTDVDEVNLKAIATLREEFQVPVGLSDHTPGVITGVAGAVLGAAVVEKHITLSRAMPGSDHAAALEEEGLRRLVQYIRLCERARGSGIKEISPAAKQAQQKLGRSLVSRIPLPSGTALTEEMLVLKSPGTGLQWRERDRILGKKAKVDVPADVLLSEDQFED